MSVENKRVILIRRDDIVRTILVRTLAGLGFEVLVYPPKTTPWVIQAEDPIAVVIHVPQGEEYEAVSFIQMLLVRRLRRPPIFFHVDDLSALHLDRLQAAGVDAIPVLSPLSTLLERLLALVGWSRGDEQLAR